MTYGETIIYRLSTLDFRLPIEKMMDKVYTNLPDRMSKEEATEYYSRKLKTYWSVA